MVIYIEIYMVICMIINNGNVQDAITNFVDFNPADFIKYKIQLF